MAMLDGLCLGNYAPTGWIVAYGQGGGDLIAVDCSITLPAELFAGSGDDTLFGGGGRNILVGGSGVDLLIGGSGPNILIAGSGASTLVAGTSGDILIGGTTAYDTGASALRALSDEWSQGGGYLARHCALSDGSGLNSPYALNATTVSTSGRRDTLIGGGGRDLFYTQVGTDLVLDRAPGEIVVPIYSKKRRTDPIT
jgi:Ca2+-binding RTX toxin-like protein